MKQYTVSVHVDLPPEEAFAAIVDPEVQSGRFMKIEVVEETPEGVGTTLRYFYRLLGMRFGGGTYTYTEYVPNERFTWKFAPTPAAWLTGGPVSATWTFEPADGGTDVTGRSEFKTRIPVVNQLARGLMVRSWRKDVATRFKAEIEKRAEKPAKVGAKA